MLFLSCPYYRSLNDVSSFFIGGVPDISLLLAHPHHVSSAGLDGGCIRHLVVEGTDYLPKEKASDDVGTGVCGRSVGGPCVTETCGGVEQAECQDDWDRAWCDCPQGTGGNNCSLGEYKQIAERAEYSHYNDGLRMTGKY